MLRTWRTVVPALLLALSAAAPARAEEGRGSERTIADRLDAIQKSVDAGRAELNVRLSMQDATIKSLLDRVEKLERETAELRRQAQSNERVARSFDPTLPRTAMFRLENRTAFATTVVINDRAYPLAPFQSLDLTNQPAGPFTYEVFVERFGVRPPHGAR